MRSATSSLARASSCCRTASAAGKLRRPSWHRSARKLCTGVPSVGLRAQAGLDGRKAAAGANLRAFGRHQIGRRVNEVIGDARIVQLGIVLQDGGDRSWPPLPSCATSNRARPAARPSPPAASCEKSSIVGAFARAAQKPRCLFERRIERFLVGLIGGQPQILAQRIVVAIDAHRARRSPEIRGSPGRRESSSCPACSRRRERPRS